MHTIVDKSHPDKLKKNAEENNPVNNKLTRRTLKNPIIAKFFLPKKYKTINPIVFANPSFTPGIVIIVGIRCSTKFKRTASARKRDTILFIRTGSVYRSRSCLRSYQRSLQR